jgi:hypothetical protein
MRLTCVHRGLRMTVKQVSQKTREFIVKTYARVNFIHAKTCIQICERRDRRPHPGRRERRIGANVRRVVGVEDLNMSRIGEQKCV